MGCARGRVDVYGLRIGRLAATEEPRMESGARGHSVAGDVGCVCVDAEHRREGLPVAEDSSGGSRQECERSKRVQDGTAAVSEPVMESSENQTDDRIKGGEKVQGGKPVKGEGEPQAAVHT